MADLESLFRIVDNLTSEEQLQLLNYIKQVRDSRKTRPNQRIFGLHEGAITMSENWDDELPDSFWFGEEDDQPS